MHSNNAEIHKYAVVIDVKTFYVFLFLSSFFVFNVFNYQYKKR